MQNLQVEIEWSPINADFVLIHDGKELFLCFHEIKTLNEASKIITRAMTYAEVIHGYDTEVTSGIYSASILAWAGKYHKKKLLEELEKLLPAS